MLPVTCAKCGKPFQVPESALGHSASCPWCKEQVLALPVAEVAIPQAPEPLSLDDDPTSTPPGRSFASRLIRTILALFSLAIVFGFSFAVARYGSGWVPEFGWVEFTAPDGSCRAEMPAKVSREEAYEPIPDFRMTKPGRRFTATGWYSKTTTSVGWIELERERDGIKTLRLDDLAGGEEARRKKELQATSTDRALVKRGDREGIEVRYRTPTGVTVDRMILDSEGAKPRLYVLSYSAPNVPPDSEPLGRFFGSFRITK